MKEPLLSGTYSIHKPLGLWNYHYLIGREVISPKCHIELQIAKEHYGWEIRLSCLHVPNLNTVLEIQDVYRKFFKTSVFGYPTEVFWNVWGQNGLFAQVTIGTLGTFDIKGDFSQGGMSLSILNKGSGRSLREFWTKRMTEDGLYSLAASNISSLQEGQRHCLQIAKSGNDVTISGAAFKTTKFRMDEDFDFKLKDDLQKVNMKRFGPSRYLIGLKGNSENEEKWIASFHGTKLILDGRSLKQPMDTRYIWIKRPQFVGTFNLVQAMGISKYGAFCRFPPILITTMKHQLGSNWVIDICDGKILMESTSVLMPFSRPFFLGQEFLANLPGFNDPFTVNGTLYSDLMTFTMANPKISLLMNMKFTSNFAVFTNQIQGTTISYKLLFQRIMSPF